MKDLTPEEWRDNYDLMEEMSYGSRKLSPVALFIPLLVAEIVFGLIIYWIFW